MSPWEAIQYLAVLLFAMAAAMAVLPVGECRFCPHCRDERKKRAEAKTRRDHDNLHRMFGPIDDCPHCEKPRG